MHIRFSDDLVIPSPGTLLGSLTHKTNPNYRWSQQFVVRGGRFAQCGSHSWSRFCNSLCWTRLAGDSEGDLRTSSRDLVDVDRRGRCVAWSGSDKAWKRCCWSGDRRFVGHWPIWNSRAEGHSRVGARCNCSHTKKRLRWFKLQLKHNKFCKIIIVSWKSLEL